jgi:hypothetical protein
MIEAHMPDSREEALDRYLAGELSMPAQRALAQTALDDPELFDLLSTISAVKAVAAEAEGDDTQVHASSPGVVVPHLLVRPSGGGEPQRGSTVARRLSARFIVGVGLAAAVVLTFAMLPRRPERATPDSSIADRPSPGATARPRLLAPRLGEPAGPGSPGAVLPATLKASRLPTAEGTITALAGGVATLGVGSLDGLSTGMELPVARETTTPVVIGRLTVTATSLEEARGRAAAATTLRVGDRITIPPAVHLAALSAQVTTTIAGDDLPTAHALAERAAAVAESAGLPADGRRAALVQLGAVEYRLEAFAEAERHYRLAQASLDAAPPAAAPERAQLLNELGAVLIAQGDYAEAGEVLLAAQSAALGMGAVAGQVANNLAAVAALRGDRTEAVSLYTKALGLVDGGQAPGGVDRRVIEQNLAALGHQR